MIRLDAVSSHQQLVITPPQSGLSLQGTVTIPGDKSISHRALMLGAIAEGATTNTTTNTTSSRMMMALIGNQK